MARELMTGDRWGRDSDDQTSNAILIAPPPRSAAVANASWQPSRGKRWLIIAASMSGRFASALAAAEKSPRRNPTSVGHGGQQFDLSHARSNRQRSGIPQGADEADSASGDNVGHRICERGGGGDTVHDDVVGTVDGEGGPERFGCSLLMGMSSGDVAGDSAVSEHGHGGETDRPSADHQHTIVRPDPGTLEAMVRDSERFNETARREERRSARLRGHRVGRRSTPPSRRALRSRGRLAPTHTSGGDRFDMMCILHNR